MKEYLENSPKNKDTDIPPKKDFNESDMKKLATSKSITISKIFNLLENVKEKFNNKEVQDYETDSR